MTTGTDSVDVAELISAMSRLAELDVSMLSRDEVSTGMQLVARLRGLLDVRQARLARRSAELAETNPSMFPEADTAAASKSSRRTANAASKRASALGDVPSMEDSLAAGSISADHVDALGRALAGLPPATRDALLGDGELIASVAEHTTPEDFTKWLRRRIAELDATAENERFERQRRANRFRWWRDADTGMICIRGELDPESGLLLASRIDTVADTMFHAGVPPTCPDGDGKQDHLRALALIALVNGDTAAGAGSGTGAGAGRGANWGSGSGSESARDGSAGTRADAGSGSGSAGADADFGDDLGRDGPGGRSGGGGHGGGDSGRGGGGGHGGGGDGGSARSGSPPGSARGAPHAGSGGSGCHDIHCAGKRSEVIVIIDAETLRNGLHAHSIINNGYGFDLPIETYRHMACTAGIIPAVLDSDGVLLDLGRDARLANRQQRRALLAMYDTCAIPGCRVNSRHCTPHHLHWWEHDGPTNLDNLLPLCSHHHTMVHTGGWHLRLHPDRSLTITYPNSSTHTTGPPARQRAA